MLLIVQNYFLRVWQFFGIHIFSSEIIWDCWIEEKNIKNATTYYLNSRVIQPTFLSTKMHSLLAKTRSIVGKICVLWRLGGVILATTPTYRQAAISHCRKFVNKRIKNILSQLKVSNLYVVLFCISFENA